MRCMWRWPTRRCISARRRPRAYLVIDKIIDAVQQTGAEAVHPGYGFLSRTRVSPKALAAAGVAFIGPPHGHRGDGRQDRIEEIRARPAVSTVPGYIGVIADADEAVKIAGEVGYPVMIKASAGGGGKGMRIAWNDARRARLSASPSRGRSSFGDDRVFIEKFIDRAAPYRDPGAGRQHGNAIYLGERECSIQRRNQKVIEEAPSPFLDEATRKAMGEQAVALAKAVDYSSAGTVEFIVDRTAISISWR